MADKRESLSSDCSSPDTFESSFQHMYALDPISSVYGHPGTKLSPTLAAFVNGVAVSIGPAPPVVKSQVLQD